MRAALAIARKDLRQRLRDRSGIVIGLVVPLVIAALMSLAFSGVDTLHLRLAVADEDHGPIAGALVSALQDPTLRSFVTVDRVGTQAAAAAAVKAGRDGAGLALPAGFSQAAATNRPEHVVTLTSVNNVIAGEIAASIVSSFVAQLNADRLSVVAAVAAGARSSPATLSVEAARLRIPISTVQRPLGATELKAISYYAPAMAIFFLLFTVSFTSRSFFVDRKQGMLERALAAPVRPVEILAGKALSVLVFGLTSLATIALVTSVFFGASWGDPAAAAIVLGAMVLSVVCLTGLVIGLARTERQAEGVSSIVVFGLALLGGNFVFVSAEPALMRTLALLTPNGWALRGLTDLATTGGGISTVLTPVLAILGFSVVTGAIAAALVPRAVRP